MVTLRDWDPAEHLRSEQERVLYFDACLLEAGDDAAFIADALATIARSRGVVKLDSEVWPDSENLYKALSAESSPSYATIAKAARALGMQLRAESLPAASAALTEDENGQAAEEPQV
ncbi:addiction module antidote protein [Massilia sp. BJB1822]|uniref:addiction module antidote protein n=1 Tax=Massilia sp. BJB1822 TaxID=2744470 RepID=UPI00159477AB|nr:putative addiction module antidote protein [Massilia sp. BJB1822]